MSRSLIALCLVLSNALFAHVHAQEASELPSLEALRTGIEEKLPGVRLSSVAETPADGLFEVIIDGGIYYVDASGDYLIEGSLIQLSSRENLTEARLGSLHTGMLAEMDEADMLIYEPDEPSERSITVFTDISCGYCRRLHADIDTLLDAGVRVRYLLFPRAGLESQGHKDLESVWCADDPLDAMTVAKSGGEVPEASCDNPIEQHVALAQQVGLRGTPLIYTDAGERIPGYRDPAELARSVLDSEPVAR